MTRIRADRPGDINAVMPATRAILDGCRECADADVHTPDRVDADVSRNVTAHYRCDRGHSWSRGFRVA